MNTTELKQAAAPMFSTVVRKLTRDHSRSEARIEIRAALDANPQITGADRRFCADYLMAQFGYGGGF